MALEYIPCAQNDNKGEQITRNFLISMLAHTEGVLLGNYHLPVNNGTRECDLVLFNQRGVWIIEVKNWHGRIKIDRVNWERDDGLIQHSPLISVENKADCLTGAKVLKPGMPAEVHISTDQRSVWSYLLKPLTDQMSRAFRQ